MIVLVCGCRDWTDYGAVRREIDKYHHNPWVSRLRLIHGGATGADGIAAEHAEVLGWDVVPFKVSREDWRKLGNAAGPIRNQRMLDDGKPHEVLAFWDGKSRGTLDMIKRSVAAGVPVKIVPMRRKGAG